MYKGIIRSILYLTASKPDIFFSVTLCPRYQSDLVESHLTIVKRIFKYLKGSSSLGLWYLRFSPLELHAYANANYAGCRVDRKNTTASVRCLEVC